MLSAGSEVDRYEVTGLLGEGGMARVYAVRHRKLGSEHALKVLTLGGVDLRARLVEEGRIQATLRHPNIVTVTDLVDVGGHPGLVMERVRGPSLDALLASGRLSADDLDTVARGILDGVAAAHAVGLVHRDLKPGNVLLERVDGRWIPKVADFGLARIVDADGRRTRTGSTMGTPWYMAPEQVRNARHAGPESDVFSLGAILYEMVTGTRAFEGDDLITLFEMMRADRFVDPAERAPDAPARWLAAIRGALVGDRERRVPTVAALRALWDGTTVPAPRVDPTWLGAPDAFPSLEPRSPRSSRLQVLVFASALLGIGTLGSSLFALLVAVWMFGLVGPTPDPAAEATPELPVAPAEQVAVPAPELTPEPTPEPTEPITPPQPPPVSVTPGPPSESRPPPATGRVDYASPTPLVLRDASGREAALPDVPPGTWTLWADFGDGLVAAGTVEVRAGATVRVTCNRLMQQCTASSP